MTQAWDLHFRVPPAPAMLPLKSVSSPWGVRSECALAEHTVQNLLGPWPLPGMLALGVPRRLCNLGLPPAAMSAFGVIC